jgi:hypothetical protein
VSSSIASRRATAGAEPGRKPRCKSLIFQRLPSQKRPKRLRLARPVWLQRARPSSAVAVFSGAASMSLLDAREGREQPSHCTQGGSQGQSSRSARHAFVPDNDSGDRSVASVGPPSNLSHGSRLPTPTRPKGPRRSPPDQPQQPAEADSRPGFGPVPSRSPAGWSAQCDPVPNGAALRRRPGGRGLLPIGWSEVRALSSGVTGADAETGRDRVGSPAGWGQRPGRSKSPEMVAATSGQWDGGPDPA